MVRFLVKAKFSGSGPPLYPLWSNWILSNTLHLIHSLRQSICLFMCLITLFINLRVYLQSIYLIICVITHVILHIYLRVCMIPLCLIAYMTLIIDLITFFCVYSFLLNLNHNLIICIIIVNWVYAIICKRITFHFMYLFEDLYLLVGN